MENDIGKLYLVPTPIGNLGDITLRALEVLKEVDLIAAEDTRHTLKLLNHFEIKKSLLSYHQHNEKEKSLEIIALLRKGKNIAVVSDAGTPGISDPGSILAQRCILEGIQFEVLPGASALITALVHSGLDTTMFLFRGFLPREEKNRIKIIEDLIDRRETLIFYEAPHRLLSTLKFLLNNLGNRKISICRELTKLHEEILRKSLEDAVSFYEINPTRGEYVLVIEGKSEEEINKEAISKWENLSIKDHILSYMNEGDTKKEAMKKVSCDRKIPKSEVYKYSFEL